MTDRKRVLSAYVPAAQTSAPTSIEFSLPLQVYIIETIERDARTKLVVGLFICQWPAFFSAANAVPSLPVSAQAAGAREISPVLMDRLAFAPGLR